MDLDLLRRSYDRFAERYDLVFTAQQRPKARALLAALPSPLPRPTVDLGAGTGLVARESGAPVVQLDASSAMLRRAAGIRVLGDLYRLPFRDGAFAAAISVTALIHFDDPAQALREIARVVRPGGPVALSVLKVEATERLEDALAPSGLHLDRRLDLDTDVGYVCRIIEAPPPFGSV